MVIGNIIIFIRFFEIIIIIKLNIIIIIASNIYVVVVIMSPHHLMIAQLNYIISILNSYSLWSHIYFYIIKLKIHDTSLIHLDCWITGFYGHRIAVSLIIEIHLFVKYCK